MFNWFDLEGVAFTFQSIWNILLYCFWKQPYLVVTTKKHLHWENMSWVDLNLPLWDDTVNFLPTVFEVCLQWTVAFRATHHCNGVGSWKWNHQNSKGISEICYSVMFLFLLFFFYHANYSAQLANIIIIIIIIIIMFFCISKYSVGMADRHVRGEWPIGKHFPIWSQCGEWCKLIFF